MMRTHRHTPEQRLLTQHPRRSSNDPHTSTPPMLNVMPDLADPPWSRGRWWLLGSLVLCAVLMALGLYGVLEALSGLWRGW